MNVNGIPRVLAGKPLLFHIQNQVYELLNTIWPYVSAWLR